MDANRSSAGVGTGSNEVMGNGAGVPTGPRIGSAAATPAVGDGPSGPGDSAVGILVLILGGCCLFCSFCDWMGKRPEPLDLSRPPAQAGVSGSRLDSPDAEIYTGLSPEEDYLAESLGRPYYAGAEETHAAVHGLTTSLESNPGYNGTAPYADYYP